MSPPKPRPEIICLCGSSRFVEQMAVIAWGFEKEGKIALGLHLLPENYPGVAADHQAEAEGVAAAMDELHLRKIDLADRVFIVNPGGYIGESTSNEIAYAKAQGKPVIYLEPDSANPRTVASDQDVATASRARRIPTPAQIQKLVDEAEGALIFINREKGSTSIKSQSLAASLSPFRKDWDEDLA